MKKEEENKEVEKTIPLAAAHFEPSGLQFTEPVTISIPNPIPGVTFCSGYRTYLSERWKVGSTNRGHKQSCLR